MSDDLDEFEKRWAILAHGWLQSGRKACGTEHFGKYQLLEKIATGGMAEVYRARAFGMAGFEKILVIKRVLDHMAKDQEFVEMFIDEARIAVRLQHVNIVQVFDLGEVDGHYFMAMEYVHGLDLSRLLTRSKNLGPFPIPLALFVAQGRCSRRCSLHTSRSTTMGVRCRSSTVTSVLRTS